MTKILVVEDEPGIALGLEDDLRLEGWDVEVVGDGLSASRRAREQSFDLILLDLILPGIGGIEVMFGVRDNMRTRAIPVAVLAGGCEGAVCQRVIAAGAQGCFSKSALDAEGFAEAIERLACKGV